MKKKIISISLCAAICIGSLIGFKNLNQSNLDKNITAMITTNTIVTPMVDDPPGL